jgi:hypothetical protein
MSQTTASEGASTAVGSGPADPPKRQRVRELVSELLRVLIDRQADRTAPIPPVWHDVQIRALEKRLKPRLPMQVAAKSSEPAAAASTPTGALEQNLDWRPFLLARIHDDFARSSEQALPD